MGGKKWHQPGHHKLWSQLRPQFSPPVQLKPLIKAHFSGRLVSNGISTVAITSVYSEKTRLKKMMMMMMKMKKGEVEMAKRFSKKYGNKG